MKKIKFIFILSFLLLAITGCKENNETPTPEVTPEVTPTVEPSEEKSYLYNAFSGSEKNKLMELINQTIPFIPSNEYYFEEEDGEIHYYTIGNTGEDFDNFNKKLLELGYTYIAWNAVDGHTYEKGNIVIKSMFEVADNNVISIYISVKGNDSTTPEPLPTYSVTYVVNGHGTAPANLTEVTALPSQLPVLTATGWTFEGWYTDQQLTNAAIAGATITANTTLYAKWTEEGQNESTSHSYNEFTSSEQAIFTETVGVSIPFILNDEYYVEKYTLVEEVGVNFYTFGNTSAEFNNYLNEIVKAGFVSDGTDVDEYGDTWYYYSKGDVLLDVSYYLYEDEYIVDLYVYIFDESIEPSTPEPTPSDSSIQKILDEANDLAEDTMLNGERIAYGTVKEIVEAYTSLYNNISFILSDGVAEILVHRAKGDCVATLKVGDAVVVSGDIKNYKGTIEFLYPQVALDGDDSDKEETEESTSRSYTDFTSSEQAIFTETVGVSIPFIPNDEYYVEKYTLVGEVGVNFYTYGNTLAEFNSYLNEIVKAGFVSDGTDVDEYGDTWYYYSKGDVLLDVSYYLYEDEYIVDLYVYIFDESIDTGDGTPTDVDLITNEGKGLPTGVDGVYNVNFKDATNVKDVTDQGYYEGGCPTTGDVKVLVIPVEFSDRTAASLGYDLDKLNLAFNGAAGTTDYYSVKEYYYLSSYGQLSLDFVVLDSWFRPSNTSDYYKSQTMDYGGFEVEIGDQMVLNEALAFLDSTMDLSEFDSDNNGMIDAVIIINTLDIDDNVTFNWAYRYWNMYTDSSDNYYEYDEVSANDYLWASYKFLFESLDDPEQYDDNNMNTYTFIHEFGHVLGADDYYDNAYINEPLSGCDIMDYMLGDHNAYSKFNYGWITSSRLVVAEESVTLTLKDFSSTGDTIIIANNWDSTLGAYQEYYVLVYYTNTGLNGDDFGYFLNDGIVIYHVNASLYCEEYDGEIYYDVYNNNTDYSDEYGTYDNLIELVKSASDTFVHTEGLSSSNNTLDSSNNKISYVFTVDSLTEEEATITFTKNSL